MELIHNVAFRVLGGSDAGTYRVVLDEITIGKTAVVRLDTPIEPSVSKGGRKRVESFKLKRKKSKPPLIGKILWMDRAELQSLKEGEEILPIEIEQQNRTLSVADALDYECRKKVMAPFLEFGHFREQILLHQGISGLVKEVIDSGKSKSFAYTNFSLLCKYGFQESSLQPARFRCGAPEVPRPCDPNGRKKPGTKTVKQRIAKAHGTLIGPEQPGMSSEWANRIMAADKRIPTPKPNTPERVTEILNSSFVTRYKHENGKLIAIDPKLGEYPNRRQIQRVLERDIPRLQRLLEKTTKGHFARSMRGIIARNWKGVAGPGHTWAIDSTIGDIYLRSSLNPAWIVGRPVVYIIVDVWSTAIVGFYVCLRGPSWDTAKVSLFSAAAAPELLGELWGYEPMLSLCPAPTMCAALLCDRGEYLSKGASITGARLIPCLSYAAPYRPDWKGIVEVLHRIAKDSQYHFVPGAIDQRRKEYDLRNINPEESVMTVRDYTAYLYTIFTKYNLIANRTHRMDAHMQAAGVFPSPAGLWRWGHEVGIGVRRSVTRTELITNLLPSEQGRVTRQGVMFAGKEYVSDVISEQQWTASARNFGGWDIQANYFPGSVSRIWTPNPAASGLLDLSLSANTTASPELTFDEAFDAFMFAKSNNAEVQHANTIIALQAKRQTEEIIRRAKQRTLEACDRNFGSKPSISEARKMEQQLSQAAENRPARAGSQLYDEAEESYLELMHSVFSATNSEGVDNV